MGYRMFFTIEFANKYQNISTFVRFLFKHND